MTKKSFTEILAGSMSWDARLEMWRALLNGALPIYEAASTGALEAAHPAAQNDRAIAFVGSGTSWALHHSNGTAWVETAPAGGSVPTGTGFRHVTGGAEDAAAKLVETADVADAQITNAKRASMADSTISGRAAGAGTGAPQDLTAAQVRTLLGLVIGTDVQAYDADLAAIAALTSAANKLVYATGAGTWDLADLTVFARTLLDDADAAAARTTLGLLSMAVQAAGAVAITGGTITGMPTPSAASDVAIKSYVDNLVAGLDWKQSVKAATTAAGTLASSFEDGDTIDGVVLATGDRILIKNQADGTENGVYVVAASGAPTRATDADSGVELVDATVAVEQGTVNADKLFTCTNDAITIGVTNITFVSFAASIVGALLAANNLSDLTNAATARTNLGVAIGTNVQAYHAILAALAGVTSAADRLPYLTGASTMDVAVFTAFARTLMDDADAAAARTTLGLAALAVLATVGTAQIDDGAVTLAKMADLATARFVGRKTAGTGDPESLTIDDARLMLGNCGVSAGFYNSHAQSSTTSSRYLGSAQQRFVVPRGWKLRVYALSFYTLTAITGSTAVCKLYVDTVDQSANFTTLQALDSTHAAGAVEATSGYYEVDATGGAEKTVEVYATLGAVGATLTISCTVIGYMFKA